MAISKSITNRALTIVQAMVNAYNKAESVIAEKAEALMDLFVEAYPEAESIPGLRVTCDKLGVDLNNKQFGNIFAIVSARMWNYHRARLYPSMVPAEKKGKGGRKATKKAKVPSFAEIMAALPGLSVAELNRLEKALVKAVAKAS